MISVITPCLNICENGREDYFHKMMESVHIQSYGDIEHIIIDGGSTDGTLAILKDYQEKGWISVLISEKDSGIYNAMNKGMRIARGEYVNIMNTDDYLLDADFFSKSISEMEKHDADFSHADKIIKSRTNKPDLIKRGDERVAYFRMPFRHQTMVVKKKIFDELGLFDESYEIAADYKFILTMLLADKIGIHIPEIAVCSLDGGISSNRGKCVKEVARVLYEMYGANYHLTKDDCKNIYLRNSSPLLLFKICLIKDKKIRKSLFFGLTQKIKKDDAVISVA